MDRDDEAAPYAIAGVVAAFPFVLVGYRATLGGTAGWALAFGPLVGGFLAGYLRGGSHERGLYAGTATALSLVGLHALHMGWAVGFDVGTLRLGAEYWLTGEPAVTVGGPPDGPVMPTYSHEAASLARFYYPLFGWSLLLGPLSGLVGGALRSS